MKSFLSARRFVLAASAAAMLWGVGVSPKASAAFGASSMTNEENANRLVRELQARMDAEKEFKLIEEIARCKHENVLCGIPTYQPVVTLAGRDNVEFKPWPFPGYWRGFQEVSKKQ